MLQSELCQRLLQINFIIQLEFRKREKDVLLISVIDKVCEFGGIQGVQGFGEAVAFVWEEDGEPCGFVFEWNADYLEIW